MKSKQVLDVQQMQHLQELGLEMKETMLYWARCVDNNPRAATHYGKWVLIKGNNAQTVGLMHWEFISTYTLQDVLDALPASIKHKDFRYYLVYNKSEGFIGYYGVDFDGNHRYARYEELYNGIDGLSVIDAAYSMLCWCIEQGYVEPNKNE
ncbi:hypothetical protein M3090_01515 [Bacteroides sp. ET71]|uniref:hypothetical protein n=1 Tax=Bacteroides sp. ET71 TaxID=2939421 RepID=UPI0020118335|nr:hypothetical protein [Bacteroides sp. ET71]MCL1615089.1 hypothetical protein [Bacteroides sp. ET71]